MKFVQKTPVKICQTESIQLLYKLPKIQCRAMNYHIDDTRNDYQRRIYGNCLSVILAVRSVMVGTPTIVTGKTTLHKKLFLPQNWYIRLKRLLKGEFELPLKSFASSELQNQNRNCTAKWIKGLREWCKSRPHICHIFYTSTF